MDIRTLFVAMAVSNLAFALGIFLYVKGQHSVHHSISIWGMSRFLAAMGLIILALRGVLLPIPVAIVFANAMIWTAIFLSVIAFKSCLNRPMPKLLSTGTAFFGFAASWVVLLLLGIPENMRVVLFSVYFAMAMIIISKDLAVGWRDNSILQKFLASFTPVLVAVTVLRGVEAVWHPEKGIFSPDSFQVVAMFIGFVETIATSFGFLLLAKEKTDRELEMQAGTDHLTGLPNRRSFYSMADKVFSLGKRTGQAMSLLLLDIDHFKKINDRFGHDTGDRVLEAFADILRSATRQCDFLVRLGGEEFGVLMPDTPPGAAGDAAERIRLAVENSEIRAGDDPVRFTVSTGVYGEDAVSTPDMDHYFRCADHALYRAKTKGRNRVEAGEAQEMNADEAL